MLQKMLVYALSKSKIYLRVAVPNYKTNSVITNTRFYEHNVWGNNINQPGYDDNIRF